MTEALSVVMRETKARTRFGASPGFVVLVYALGGVVSWGAGLRAAQFLVLGAKARALLSGRAHVNTDDVRALVHSTFRHRILINYRAEAEGLSVEKVIERLLETVKPSK